MYTLANTMPLYLLEKYQRDENGDEIVFSRFKNRTNPYLSVNDYFNDIERDRIFGNITMRYNFNDWLYIQGRIGEDYWARFQKTNFPSQMAGIPPAPEGFVNGWITHVQNKFREINSDFLIGANRMVGEKIEIDLTAGGNIMYQKSERNSVRGENFIVPGLYTIGNSGIQSPVYSYSERRVNSLYGAAEIGYDNFLFINATLRNDWFSTLSPEERSVLYPSISSSFVFTQALGELPYWLDFGKIRLAYAEVGSDTDVSPFSQSLGYNLNSSLFNGQPLGSISTGTVPNANLRPMRVKEYEVGLNVRMFKRVNLDLTYYRKLSIDQILQATISNTSGYNAQLINVGESENRGVEMMLGIAVINDKPFTWDVNINGSFNTSEVLKLGLDDEDVSIGGRIRQVVGQPLGQIYEQGYERDEDGNKIFNANSGLPLRTSQPIHLGNAIPKWIGGITNTFNYKGVSLSALVDFKLGHDILSMAEFDYIRHGKHKKTLEGRDVGYVVGDGVNPDGSVNTKQVDVQTFWEQDARVRESTMYNAGFWKLRQISTGYDLARIGALKRILSVKELNLSIVANNVLTIKRWTDNMDPEQVHDNDGLQWITLPMTRSYGFNLRVVF